MMHEVWVHPTALAGYEPATEHIGWVQPFGTDGKQIEELNPAPDSPPVAGWRTACECGWRGGQYYRWYGRSPAGNSRLPGCDMPGHQR